MVGERHCQLVPAVCAQALPLAHQSLTATPVCCLLQVWWGKVFNTSVDDLKFSPCGTFLAAAGHDQVVTVLDITRGYTQVAKCGGHTSAVRHLDWAADSSAIQSTDQAYEVGDLHKVPWGSPAELLVCFVCKGSMRGAGRKAAVLGLVLARWLVQQQPKHTACNASISTLHTSGTSTSPNTAAFL